MPFLSLKMLLGPRWVSELLADLYGCSESLERSLNEADPSLHRKIAKVLKQMRRVIGEVEAIAPKH
jgi:hypothetical protein